MKKAGSIGGFTQRLPGMLLRWFNMALLAVCAISAAMFGGMMVAAGGYRIWFSISGADPEPCRHAMRWTRRYSVGAGLPPRTSRHSHHDVPAATMPNTAIAR